MPADHAGTVIFMDIGSGAEVRERSGPSNDESLFGPGSMTWRVHADRVFAIGGVRALILQALHPLTMAAVAQQRGFEEDFWGRLDRTGAYVSTLTYAPAHEARRTAAKSGASTANCSARIRRPATRSGSIARTCCCGCTAARSNPS